MGNRQGGVCRPFLCEQNENASCTSIFSVYYCYLEAIERSPARSADGFLSCLLYSSTGETPKLRENKRYMFDGMRKQINRDNANCLKSHAVNKANGAQNGKANGSERYHSLPNGSESHKEKEKDKDKDKEKEKEKEKEKGKENDSLPSMCPKRNLMRLCKRHLNISKRHAKMRDP